MSDSVLPHRPQLTRLPCPWDSQARTLEWVAISFSNAWKWKVKAKSLSRVWPSVTPWTTAFQAPLSMGFSRQEYWSGVRLPSPERIARLIESWIPFQLPNSMSLMALEWENKTKVLSANPLFLAEKSHLQRHVPVALFLLWISEMIVILCMRSVVIIFLNLFFNWRKIAWQCCDGFCRTTTWIIHNYTYITSLLSLPPLMMIIFAIILLTSILPATWWVSLLNMQHPV